MKRNKINPIFTVINHYRPISDNEKLVERYHGRTPKKGRKNDKTLYEDMGDGHLTETGKKVKENLKSLRTGKKSPTERGL